MTTTEAPAPAFRYIGITDECTECENCHKPELRSTVVIMPLDADGNDEGDPVHYGSSCAARALSVRGGGGTVRKSAEGAMVRTMIAALDAIEWLTRHNLTRDGRANDLAVKLGMADELLAALDTEILAARVAAVRDADSLGEDTPRAWLKRHGYA
jgi:hypothetical protein